MTILLAGDIGGTKTNLRLVTADAEGLNQEIVYEETYASQDFLDLVPMVRKFFTTATEVTKENYEPKKACFGIAGPVVNNSAELTNLSWSLSAQRLQKELNINKVTLINDFAAIGYGVLGLADEDLYTLQKGTQDKKAPIAVIGAGTGLGEGFLIPLPNGEYQVFGSEGSHADFAPRSNLEIDLLKYLLDKHGLIRASVERVVSGTGIPIIYQFLRSRESSLESEKLQQIYNNWEAEIGTKTKTIDLAAEISRAALAKTDKLCQQTMKLFIEAYGAEAGNLALKLLPYGGLYVAGGVTAKNISLIKESHFLTAFKAKGRLTPVLERIPVHCVLNQKVGLIGAALCAARMSSQ